MELCDADVAIDCCGCCGGGGGWRNLKRFVSVCLYGGGGTKFIVYSSFNRNVFEWLFWRLSWLFSKLVGAAVVDASCCFCCTWKNGDKTLGGTVGNCGSYRLMHVRFLIELDCKWILNIEHFTYIRRLSIGQLLIDRWWNRCMHLRCLNECLWIWFLWTCNKCIRQLIRTESVVREI